MQLVEQHCISKSDPRYSAIDEAAFKSKNLYNAALYEMRQAFIHQGIYLSYEEMDKRMQSHEAYRALPAKVSQQVLRQLADSWKAFREAKAAYEADPSKFTGRPKLPKYKHKQEGRNMLVYTILAISRGKKGLQRGIIKPSMLPIEVKTQQDPKQIDQVRIVPRNGHYVVEVVHTKEPVQAKVDPSFCVAIDLGVTNLAAITSNREGFVPRLVFRWKFKKRATPVKPALSIWTLFLPTHPMMIQSTSLAGSGLDGETACTGRKMDTRSVPM